MKMKTYLKMTLTSKTWIRKFSLKPEKTIVKNNPDEAESEKDKEERNIYDVSEEELSDLEQEDNSYFSDFEKDLK